MARPTIDDATKLSHSLPPVRCTEAEKQLIKINARKAGLSVTEYIRQMTFRGKVVIQENNLDLETIHQLRKLGINLNQQTKKLNATGVMPVELKHLWVKLDAVLDKMLEEG